MLVINLFGVPSSGKSTGAAYIFYNNDTVLGEDFNRVVMNVFHSYNNRSYLLLRTKPYNPAGRYQTEDESDALKEPMIQLLKDRNIPYLEVGGDIEGYQKIVKDVLKHWKDCGNSVNL